MTTQDVTTVGGHCFTAEESELMAALIYKRFGYEIEAAAAAWRRLLGNSCPDAEFAHLAGRGLLNLEGRYRISAIAHYSTSASARVRGQKGRR